MGSVGLLSAVSLRPWLLIEKQGIWSDAGCRKRASLALHVPLSPRHTFHPPAPPSSAYPCHPPAPGRALQQPPLALLPPVSAARLSCCGTSEHPARAGSGSCTPAMQGQTYALYVRYCHDALHHVHSRLLLTPTSCSPCILCTGRSVVSPQTSGGAPHAAAAPAPPAAAAPGCTHAGPAAQCCAPAPASWPPA